MAAGGAKRGRDGVAAGAFTVPAGRTAGYAALPSCFAGRKRRRGGIFARGAELVRQAAYAIAHTHGENLFRSAGSYAVYKGKHQRRKRQCIA